MRQLLRSGSAIGERVMLLTIETALTPNVAAETPAKITELLSGLSRVVSRFGFMEIPDVPRSLTTLQNGDTSLDPMRTTYFLSRQSVIPSKKPGMALWREALFAILMRNAEMPWRTYRLLVNRVVEIGSRVEI